MLHLLLVFLFSLAIGSFSNVCIYRIPLNLSVMAPNRSFCPWCNRQISWRQNIPLLSFLWQRARCVFCKSHISSRYFFVELLLPIVVLCFLVASPRLGTSELVLVEATVFFSIVISFIDLDWRIVPDSLSFSWLGIALALAPLNPLFNALPWNEAYYQAMLGAATAACVVWITLSLGHLLKQRDVMGWGDVKLMACWGALLGWHGAVVFFIAAAFATTWILFCFLFKKLRANDFLPFGPFINIAGILMLWADLTGKVNF
jgi:leader peptidase (prepilin peptidase)/N-methyltransferase